MRHRALLLAMSSIAGGCTAGGTGFDTPNYVAVGQVPTQPPAAAGSLSQILLAAHNRERSAVRAPMLRWDAQLAASAAVYAAELARRGELVHSSRASRPGQGENLWMGTAGAYSPEQMVQSWVNERRLFRPGTFPNVSTSGSWSDVGHYTQMIWRSTTAVGCAIQRSGRWDVLVCRYSPTGNVRGQAVP